MKGLIKGSRFNREADVASVNVVMLAEAHVAKNVEVRDKFIDAFNMFCTSRVVSSKVEEQSAQWTLN